MARTTWDLEFKADSPASYAEAIELAATTGLVVDVERETTVLGDACVAILVADRTPAFWMDHKPSRKAAEALCK
ncbi:hypothetical protein WKW79_33745 [Variovorax robiniae]|uniref:DUF2188 domain-containing protein n=1 Tax=Variovorax robiniae TaxID=1836199 RepID=A0ABU8XJA2_9BURK